MFDILFGWRKASKCKKLIKQVQCRLKLLKNKRCAVVNQLRGDIVQLIRNGYQETAFNRVEQIIKNESTKMAYELLENFCEFILVNLSYIRKHKDCPNDVNEAVSSLIYASARCGDLPELQLIRKLFGERYGHRFAMTAVELCPGNLVNSQIKEKLRTKTVSDDEKHRMIKEIVRDSLQPEILALEYRSDWHQKQVLPKEVQTHDGITEGPKIQVSNTNEIKRKDLHIDSYLTTSCISHYNYLESQKPSQYMMEIPKDKTEGKVDWCNEVDFPDQLQSNAANSKEWKNNVRACTVNSEHEEERKTSASSWGSSPRFPEEEIVYLDDVVELRSSTSREGDKRLFKFKSPSLPKRDIVKDSYGQTDMEEGSESWSEAENSSSKSSGRNRNGSEKGTRRGIVSKEMQRTKDIECVSYSNHEISSIAEKNSIGKISPIDNKEMEWANFYKKQRKNSNIRSTATNVFTNPDYDNVEIKNMEMTEKTWEKPKPKPKQKPKQKPEAPYVRAVTFPSEREKESKKGSIPRTNSCPYKHPNHVHPKLPEYEDIEAKFLALKREHLQNKSLKP